MGQTVAVENHVFTCINCNRQWTVYSDSPGDCFFYGLCFDCIRELGYDADKVRELLTGAVVIEN